MQSPLLQLPCSCTHTCARLMPMKRANPNTKKSGKKSNAGAKKSGALVMPKLRKGQTIAPHVTGDRGGNRGLIRRTAVGMSRDMRKSIMSGLYLSGTMSYVEIVDYMKDNYGVVISAVQVCHDFKEMKEQWRKNAEINVADMIETELAKLDRMENVAMELWERFHTNDYLNILLKIAKRRSNLKGLDSPIKVHSTGDRTPKEMTTAELHEYIRKHSDEKPDKE